MHEYEALLFSDPSKIALEFSHAKDELTKIREKYTPEEINLDNYPSKRLEDLSQKQYRKTFHGILIAQYFGLETIRQECQHFNSWLVQLEQLAN